jgi:hypothetical protein
MVSKYMDIGIGICGKQNSGKNLTAELLVNMFHHSSAHSVDIAAFADPIKQMAELMFPWANPEGWYGASHWRDLLIPDTNDKEGKPLTYRRVLIDIGSLGRAYDKDHWVKVFDAKLKCGYRDLMLSPDVRYPNELNYLNKEGFFLIKLKRDVVRTSTSSTETAQDSISPNEFDAIIENDGTIDDLKSSLLTIKQAIIAKCSTK